MHTHELIWWFSNTVPRLVRRSCAGNRKSFGSSPARKRRSWSVRMKRMLKGPDALPRPGAAGDSPGVAADASAIHSPPIDIAAAPVPIAFSASRRLVSTSDDLRSAMMRSAFR